MLRTLQPGNVLALAPGTYPGLPISNLNGLSSAWITITGPKSGPPAVILGGSGRNTVEISNSSYVVIQNLRIDSRGIAGAFGIAAHGGEDNLTHDIRIEDTVFVGQNGNQQTDGISTKTPTWGWVIRNNQILGAGTGLYLGNSNGADPFVGGIIENNLIQDTIGYNMEIKHQTHLPEIEGMPKAPVSTIIRNNVFIKNDFPSPDGDRPNVFVGGFPFTGPGSLNMYEIYGNVFIHNHREALLQASGRVSVHDNIFVDGPYTYPAVLFRDHEHPLKVAYVYNNTVYTWERGIYFGSRARIADAVIGNLVFAMTPISGQIMSIASNLTDSVENAPKYVASPAVKLGSMDFYPLLGRCKGAPIDIVLFRRDTDYAMDFNHMAKVRSGGQVVFRGAYASEGKNAGWRLEAAVKPEHSSAMTRAPAIVSINRSNAQAGRQSVTIIGANFTPDAMVSVTGDELVVGDVIVSSPTEITATFALSNNSSSQSGELTVTTKAGTSNTMKLVPTSSRRRTANR